MRSGLNDYSALKVVSWNAVAVTAFHLQHLRYQTILKYFSARSSLEFKVLTPQKYIFTEILRVTVCNFQPSRAVLKNLKFSYPVR